MRLAVALLLLPTSLALGAGNASAQDAGHRATARELFEEGVTFVDAEQWAEAGDRFSRALALYDSAMIRFNLARVRAEQGRVVEAAEQLRNVIRREDSGDEVRAAATEQLATIEPRIAHLTIRVEGEADEVQREGVTVPTAALGVALAVDPGTHGLTALRDGVEVGRASVSVAEGESTEVVLVAVSLEVVPDPVITPDPIVEDRGDGTPLWQEWWLWTIVGVLVIGAAVGIGVGVAVSQDDGCTGPFMPCRLALP